MGESELLVLFSIPVLSKRLPFAYFKLVRVCDHAARDGSQVRSHYRSLKRPGAEVLRLVRGEFGIDIPESHFDLALLSFSDQIHAFLLRNISLDGLISLLQLWIGPAMEVCRED